MSLAAFGLSFARQWSSPEEFAERIWFRVAYLGRYGGFGLHEILALDNAEILLLQRGVAKLLREEQENPRGNVASGG